MLIITISVATDVVEIDLLNPEPGIEMETTSNQVSLTADGRLAWNGRAISDPQLAALLAQSKSMPVIPELRSEP